MSSSPVPSPKKLYRSRQNQMLGGVCSGVANYLNMDPTLIRILTVLVTLFTGVPIILYVIALFVVPEEPKAPYPPVGSAPPYGSGYAGGHGAAGRRGEDQVWGADGPPWEQPQSAAAAEASSPFRGLRPTPPTPPQPAAPPPAPPAGQTPDSPGQPDDWQQPGTPGGTGPTDHR
ncbi:MAG: hypothetical protein JWP61_697 [Friedmanniella sp.]|nr:hypothetical protein [Friedmanniella sp.]